MNEIKWLKEEITRKKEEIEQWEFIASALNFNMKDSEND